MDTVTVTFDIYSIFVACVVGAILLVQYGCVFLIWLGYRQVTNVESTRRFTDQLEKYLLTDNLARAVKLCSGEATKDLLIARGCRELLLRANSKEELDQTLPIALAMVEQHLAPARANLASRIVGLVSSVLWWQLIYWTNPTPWMVWLVLIGCSGSFYMAVATHKFATSGPVHEEALRRLHRTLTHRIATTGPGSWGSP